MYTIAPTGTISILSGCSSGIEPNFLLAYWRTVRETHADGDYQIKMVNPVLEKELKRRGLYSDELIDKIIANGGTLKGMSEIPEDMRNVFIISFDVPVEEHLAMQNAFQKHCDNAVSKTINLKAQATQGDVSNAYLTAYKLGLKGVTIYRDGSLDAQVLNAVTPTPSEPQDTMTDEEIAQFEKESGSQFSECPECGKKAYVHESGCGYCINCGKSKCK